MPFNPISRQDAIPQGSLSLASSIHLQNAKKTILLSCSSFAFSAALRDHYPSILSLAKTPRAPRKPFYCLALPLRSLRSLRDQCLSTLSLAKTPRAQRKPFYCLALPLRSLRSLRDQCLSTLSLAKTPRAQRKPFYCLVFLVASHAKCTRYFTAEGAEGAEEEKRGKTKMFFIIISSANPCDLRGRSIGLCSPCIPAFSAVNISYALTFETMPFLSAYFTEVCGHVISPSPVSGRSSRSPNSLIQPIRRAGTPAIRA